MPEEPKVEFSVKELLADIRSMISRIDSKLDSKADRSDVVRLENRVDAVEKDVVSLKQEMHGDRQANAKLESWRRYRGPIVTSIIVTLILAAATIIPVLLHK